MVKAAKEIQMENPREAETPSTGATCSPPEEQAKKPSMLCFKKRKKSCKKGLAMKDACEGASEEKSQCVSTDQEEAKASNPSQSSKGTWAAIKNLARPGRRQKSSSRKKVPSDSQVQLEMDAEESCAQDLPKKRASSGVKIPCVRFSRGKKKPSPSEAVEESEGSVQANEVMGVVNKASVACEEPEDLAPTDKSESFSPVSAQEEQDMVKQEQHRMKEDQDTMKEKQDIVKEDQDTVKEKQDIVKEDQDTVKEKQDIVKEDQDTVKEEQDIVKEDQDTVKEEQDIVKEDQDIVKEDQDMVKEDHDTAKESDTSVGKSEPLTEPTGDAEERSECTVQLEITDSETVDETAQDKLQKGSLPQTTNDVEGREVAPEALVSKDQPDSTPEITEWQEIPNICKEMPERDELEKSIKPPECKAEKVVTDFSELSSGGDVASVQEAAGVKDAVSVQNAESMRDAVSVQDAASVQDAVSMQEAASVQDAVSVQDAAIMPDATTVQDTASAQEAVSVQGAASVQDAASMTGASTVKDTANMQDVVSVQEAASVQDAVNAQDIASMKDAASVQEAVSEQEAASVQEAVSEQEAASVQAAVSEQEAASVQEAVSEQEAAGVQECSSHRVLEANAGPGVSIVITITEAEDSDNTDSDQAYEPSPVLHQKKQKGNKKSDRNADVGQKEGPEAGGSPQAEEKALADQGHRTGEQYELLLMETASSLVKAAIQSSIEQLVNEMALEQNKHNSFL